eukprot:1168269-Rhodomonas_salina.1
MLSWMIEDLGPCGLRDAEPPATTQEDKPSMHQPEPGRHHWGCVRGSQEEQYFIAIRTDRNMAPL